MQLKALVSMTRPGNSLMAAIGILIGFLYSGKPLDFTLLLLIIAGMTALGFGNVINDIVDVNTDTIAHPQRPLVTGAVTPKEASLFAITLTLLSISFGFSVSVEIGFATLIPIVILTLYSLLLKGTPLAGNITVSLLIAYTLLYGAWGGDYFPLIMPAILAALSNFSREIIKDLADKEGDLASGLNTTATLPTTILNVLVWGSGLAALLIAPMPYILRQLGLPYLIVVLVFVVPLGVSWLVRYTKKEFAQCAKLLKFEMLAGLSAILFDTFLA